MGEPIRSAIVISASSDIGTAVCERWVTRGWNVVGTYRTPSDSVRELRKLGVELVHCDLAVPGFVSQTCAQLINLSPRWDVLVLCPGKQEPIGAFHQCDFDQWEESVMVNFTSQMRLIHAFLPYRRIDENQMPCVLLFAGGGTNDAPVNYSAYIASKIALIKMCELL